MQKDFPLISNHDVYNVRFHFTQDVLLTHVVSSLLGVISAPVSQTDQQVDMPQVHAMNILKAVMKESSVAMAVMRHVAPIVMAAVEGFASPHWAIRNAATQLFGQSICNPFCYLLNSLCLSFQILYAEIIFCLSINIT